MLPPSAEPPGAPDHPLSILSTANTGFRLELPNTEVKEETEVFASASSFERAGFQVLTGEVRYYQKL